jgi:hypothetical protein
MPCRPVSPAIHQHRGIVTLNAFSGCVFGRLSRRTEERGRFVIRAVSARFIVFIESSVLKRTI